MTLALLALLLCLLCPDFAIGISRPGPGQAGTSARSSLPRSSGCQASVVRLSGLVGPSTSHRLARPLSSSGLSGLLFLPASQRPPAVSQRLPDAFDQPDLLLLCQTACRRRRLSTTLAVLLLAGQASPARARAFSARHLAVSPISGQVSGQAGHPASQPAPVVFASQPGARLFRRQPASAASQPSQLCQALQAPAQLFASRPMPAASIYPNLTPACTRPSASCRLTGPYPDPSGRPLAFRRRHIVVSQPIVARRRCFVSSCSFIRHFVQPFLASFVQISLLFSSSFALPLSFPCPPDLPRQALGLRPSSSVVRRRQLAACPSDIVLALVQARSSSSVVVLPGPSSSRPSSSSCPTYVLSFAALFLAQPLQPDKLCPCLRRQTLVISDAIRLPVRLSRQTPSSSRPSVRLQTPHHHVLVTPRTLRTSSSRRQAQPGLSASRQTAPSTDLLPAPELPVVL